MRQNKSLLNQFESENICYSNDIKKIQPDLDIYNERQIVITEFEVYNLKYGLIKRKIKIADLGGVSKAM